MSSLIEAIPVDVGNTKQENTTETLIFRNQQTWLRPDQNTSEQFQETICTVGHNPLWLWKIKLKQLYSSCLYCLA